MAVFAVTNTNDTGAGSLRAAIDQSNNTPGIDTITFNISAADKTIRPTAGLVLYDAAVLDATTQPGYAGQPLIRIDGAAAGTTDGVKLYGNSTVKGLSITSFNGAGITTVAAPGQDGHGNAIRANWLGLDLAGNAAGNKGMGLGIFTPTNVIDGNVISSNGADGIFILGGIFGSSAGGNLIQYNRIGTNPAGNVARGNGRNGMDAQDSPGNSILNNLFSANADNGIMFYGVNSSGQIAKGNLIGLDASGANAMGNGLYGMEMHSSNNVIGGTTAAERNVISANAWAGIVIDGDLGRGAGNQVKGNYIGTDSIGTKARGNHQQGICFVNNAGANQIGGTEAGAGNTICSNGDVGIAMFPGNGEVIQGNRIGIGVANGALGNAAFGIVAYNSTGTVIGGNTAAAGNVIAYNAKQGIGPVDAGADKGNNTLFGNFGDSVGNPPPPPPPAAPQLQAAVSRVAHAGTAYDIALPLTGTPGVECRAIVGGATIVMTFDKPIASASATVTAGTATVGTVTPAAGNVVYVNLANVVNTKLITITLTNVVATDAGTAASATVTWRALEGDVNGNGSVSAADVNLIKANVGKAVDATNFRMDVNANGAVTSSDVNLGKFYVGTTASAAAMVATAPTFAPVAASTSSEVDVLSRSAHRRRARHWVVPGV
jgi:hypothetical protein